MRKPINNHMVAPAGIITDFYLMYGNHDLTIKKKLPSHHKQSAAHRPQFFLAIANYNQRLVRITMTCFH
jgi:hypothetical protein